jgi:hypothetical protein
VRSHNLVGLVALVAALLLAVASCGGDDGDGDAQATAGSTIPTCTAKAPGAERPEGFPRSLPLPTSFVVTGGEPRSGGRLVLDGVASDDFETTLHFLQRELPKAGYRLTEGEVEEHDAESNFSGHGLRGRWAIRVADGCPDRTTVEVVVQPS